MPDYKDLKLGDRIRLIRIPALDMEQHKRECRSGDRTAPGFSTMRVLQYLIDRKKICIIDEIDEFGHPWFSCSLRNEVGHGAIEWHFLNIVDDISWEFA